LNRNYSFSPMASTTVVTKSGTNDSKAKARRGGGGGGGSGQGTGSGSGSGIAGGSAAGSVPNAPPASLADADEVLKVLSPEEQRHAELQAKLHPSILALVDRLKSKSAPVAAEAKFVRDGKAEIQIWLTEKSEATLAQLKQLGFEVVLDPKTAKLVIGRLSIEKLEALSDLKFVRYVAPQLSSN